jgi:hypothetical protein
MILAPVILNYIKLEASAIRAPVVHETSET